MEGIDLIKLDYIVEGMTCVACEAHLEQSLSKLEHVVSVQADHQKKSVIIQAEKSLDDRLVAKNIEAAGYQMVVEAKKPKAVLLVVVALAAFLLLIRSTIGFNFLPEVTASTSYWMLFVIGLLTSLHCISMCGGINVAVTARPVNFDHEVQTLGSKLVPSLAYNLGRVTAYTIIGGLVGAMGAVISFNDTMRGVITLFAAGFMILMGIGMLGIIPKLRLPFASKQIAAKLYGINKGKSAYLVGLANGFMPCGPLQTMQLYALGTGSFITGALSMLAFSLGTVPLMLTLGVVATFLSRNFSKNLVKVGAVLIIGMGLVMVNRGFSLAGSTGPLYQLNGFEQPASNRSIVSEDGTYQTVTIEVQNYFYEPITVVKDIPVIFNLHADENQLNGCNGAIQIVTYGIKKGLMPGDNIVEFTPTESGEFNYSCWMGMINSTITVVESY